MAALYHIIVDDMTMSETSIRGIHHTRLEAEVYGSSQYCDYPLILRISIQGLCELKSCDAQLISHDFLLYQVMCITSVFWMDSVQNIANL